MTPMGSPSRISGTPIIERTCATSASPFLSYKGSSIASAIRTTSRSHGGSPNDRPRTGRDRRRALDFHVLRIEAISRRESVQVLIQPEYDSRVGAAEARCGINHTLQNRLQIELRPADDIEHLRSRSLLFQRLGQVGRALAQFTEQPRVLDGDDGLRGEILHQRDLLVGEGANLLAIDANNAHKLIILEQRYEDKRTGAGVFCERAARVFFLEISRMNELFRSHELIDGEH